MTLTFVSNIFLLLRPESAPQRIVKAMVYEGKRGTWDLEISASDEEVIALQEEVEKWNSFDLSLPNLVYLTLPPLMEDEDDY